MTHLILVWDKNLTYLNYVHVLTTILNLEDSLCKILSASNHVYVFYHKLS